jgi:hypothetical protein
VAAAGPLAITVSGAKLSVIDASVDPPQLRGSVAVPGEHVVATDHLALIAAGNAGLQLVDFSDPSAPAIVGSAAIPSYMVSVSRTLACVAAGNTVHMIDVSNPHAPVVRGSLAFYTGVQAVDLEGGRLYVACAGYAQDGSLTIVDASDPDHLAALGSVHRPWDEWSAPTGVAVQGTRAYLTLQDIPSLEIIDVSDPMAPHVTASVDVVEPLVDIAVRGTTAYLAAGYAGLVLVDISEGGTPHVIGGLATPDNLLEVAAGSDGVYLGYGFPVRVAPLQCGPTILAHGSAQFEEGGLATRPATPAVAPPLSLQAAHPSPFRERTGLSFALSQTRAARVSVYDVTGRLVRTLLDTELTAGGHEIAWDGKDGRGAAVAPGTYFVRLQAGQQSAVQRVTRVR